MPPRRRAGAAAAEAFGRVAPPPGEPAATPPAPAQNGAVPAPEPAAAAPAPPAPEMTEAARKRTRQLLRSAALKAVADHQRARESMAEWEDLKAGAARDGAPAGMVVAAARDADPEGNILGDLPA